MVDNDFDNEVVIDDVLDAIISIHLTIGLNESPVKYCGEEYYEYSVLKNHLKTSNTALDSVLFKVEAIARPYNDTYLYSLRESLAVICEYNECFKAKDKFLQEALYKKGL